MQSLEYFSFKTSERVSLYAKAERTRRPFGFSLCFPASGFWNCSQNIYHKLSICHMRKMAIMHHYSTTSYLWHRIWINHSVTEPVISVSLGEPENEAAHGSLGLGLLLKLESRVPVFGWRERRPRALLLLTYYKNTVHVLPPWFHQHAGWAGAGASLSAVIPSA